MKIRKGGFTLVEILIVVAIIGIIAAVAIPNFVRARTVSIENACHANAKQLQTALDRADIDSNGQIPTKNLSENQIEVVVSPDYLRSMPHCSVGHYSSDGDGNVICSVHNAATVATTGNNSQTAVAMGHAGSGPTTGTAAAPVSQSVITGISFDRIQ